MTKHSAVVHDVRRYESDRVVDISARKPADEPRLVIRATVDDAADRAALRSGLLAKPATTSPKFLYDPQGAALFTAICALDEYYPTRVEASIFEADRDAIAHALPAGAQWIDLGCGDGMKARGWIDPAAMRRYVGVDIAARWLRCALRSLAAARAQGAADARTGMPRPRALEILGVVADFTRPFELHDILAERPDLPPVFFYPGSSIGNFAADDARAFLASVREHIARHPAGRDGRILIGVDLVKDRTILEAAYDDALGVTAAFDRNVLRVANRILDADFDPAAFEHRARYEELSGAARGRIAMQLVARRAHVVRIGDASVFFDEGEAITTEYSHKYTIDGFADLLASAGFAREASSWRDDGDRFAVFVARPA